MANLTHTHTKVSQETVPQHCEDCPFTICIECTGPLQAWELSYHLDCGQQRGWPDAETDWTEFATEYNDRVDERREMEIAESSTQGASTDVMIRLKRSMDEAEARSEALYWHRVRMAKVSRMGEN